MPAVGILGRQPLFCARGMLVGANDGAIEQQPFQVGILEFSEDAFPNPLPGPAVESPPHAVPVAEALGQISPGSPGFRDPEDCVDEQAIILRRGLNETFPLSGDSGIRESNSARKSSFWFARQGGGRWLGVVSILRKTSDESSMRNARAIPISWFATTESSRANWIEPRFRWPKTEALRSIQVSLYPARG